MRGITDSSFHWLVELIPVLLCQPRKSSSEVPYFHGGWFRGASCFLFAEGVPQDPKPKPSRPSHITQIYPDKTTTISIRCVLFFSGVILKTTSILSSVLLPLPQLWPVSRPSHPTTIRRDRDPDRVSGNSSRPAVAHSSLISRPTLCGYQDNAARSLTTVIKSNNIALTSSSIHHRPCP